MTAREWIAESDRLRALAVRASGDHARALHDRADGAVREADLAERAEARVARAREGMVRRLRAIDAWRRGPLDNG